VRQRVSSRHIPVEKIDPAHQNFDEFGDSQHASRYFYVGGQLPFAVMVALIVGLWGVVLAGSWWLEKKRTSESSCRFPRGTQ